MASYLHMTPDDMAFWTLVATVVGVIVAIVGAVAAILAAKYGKDAPTADDLARVEDNTAHLEEMRERIAAMETRSKREAHREELNTKAGRVSISVSANNFDTDPLEVLLQPKEPVTLTHIELTNDAGSKFGSVPCKKVAENEYIAPVESKTVAAWFHGGWNIRSTDRKHLNLGVFMMMEEQEVSRTMAVTLIQGQQPTPTGSKAVWILEGHV